MRQLSVPPCVRRLSCLTATTVAVAAAAGCMSVADDGRPPAPSHPAAHRSGRAAPDGGTVISDGVGGVGARAGKAAASGDASAAASGSASPAAATPRGATPSAQETSRPPRSARPSRGAPPEKPSTPRATPSTPAPPPPPPPTPTPEPSPTTAEPSSSAHAQQAGSRLLREPAPQAGSPA
ncbi:hypothetical protein ACIRF8_25695 [Streptomyces sp. NPDC102406]|uniref:hypothetical protein n=1 Tax=Streptomyces sp. NPDC102406 TaxID=3366171 RepID=UPI00380DAB47